jgi:Fe-S-cluster-containing dehydrogenase component
MACPYDVRHLNKQEGVVEKCTLCEQKIAGGDLPECVRQCCGRARFFGDLDKGLESFMGPGDGTVDQLPITASSKPWTEADVHTLVNVDNNPSSCFILRGRTWRD